MNHSKAANTNRLNWIDQTKGLAILGIVIFHFFQNYPDRNPLVSILDRNLAKVGYAAVDIFFVLAGFNTSYVLISKYINSNLSVLSINWKNWLYKRLIRLYPAYLLAVISSCLIYYFFGKLPVQSALKFTLSVLGLAGISLQAINPGFWFFTAILEAYLLTPLLFLICKNQPKRILWLGIIIAIITKIISLFFLLNRNTPWHLFFLQNNFIGSYISQFCIGIFWGFIYAEHQNLRKIDLVLSITIGSIGLLLYGLLSFSNVDIIYMLGFDMLFTPAFVVILKYLFSRLEIVNKFTWLLSLISLLGIYSYQIYLVHQPLYIVLLPKLNKMIPGNVYLKILINLLISLLLLTIYVLTFIKVERWVNKKIDSLMNKQKS